MLHDDEHLRLLVKQSVQEAVEECMSHFGFCANNMHEVQADLHYLRLMRKGSEAMAQRVKTTLLGVLIPTFLYLLWEAIRHLIAKGN